MSEDEEWLNVGKSFVKIQSEQQNNIIENKINENLKEKKKKDKKKEKLSQAQQQIAIKFTEEEIEAYYDQKLENQYKIDTSKSFIYKHEMGVGLLSVQVLPIGDNQILAYGFLEQDIPHYVRTNQQRILGMKNQKKVNQIFDSVIRLRDKSTFEYTRYTEAAQIQPEKSYMIQNQSKLCNEDFVPFNNQLVEVDPISKDQKLQERNLELQNQLQTNVNDLEIWKEFLLIQEKIAELQGYNEPLLLANRRLSILQKLEQVSEVLSDHPWVLAYKISLMQNLELRNDELHKEIDNSWSELFSKYVHIQPIWILFLDHKLKTEIFSATMLRIEASKHIANLQKLINETTRAQLVQLFKRIYIELIQQISFYESEMGFKERSVGILQALCEMNLFAPKHLQRTYDLEEKVKEFRNYWDLNVRTGEQNDYGWRDTPELKEDFIGYFDSSLQIQEQEDQIQQFLSFQQLKRWRPANQRFDIEWIKQNVDAVVIYEDIEPYLYIFNDQESKLNIVSILLQQIGYPPIDSYILPQINQFHSADMCYNKISFDYLQNEFFIKYQSIFQCKLQNNLSQFVYVKRLLEKVYQQINNQFLLVYLFMLYGILYLNNDLIAPNQVLQQELKSGLKQIKNILKDQQNNLVLWILYHEIESLKKQQYQVQLISQIKLYAKSKKQKLMILYFEFIHLSSYEKSVNIIKEALKAYGEDTNISDSTLVLKLRNLYRQSRNKWQNIDYLFQYKKELQPFSLSKRSILLIFFLFLQQNAINENLCNLMQESNQLKIVHFTDQYQRRKILIKYKNEVSLILLNLLRFSQEKEEICKVALKLDQDQIIFFITYIHYLTKKFLYFQRLVELQDIIQLQSPQICWIAYVLNQDPNKSWFLVEYLKNQTEKGLAQIYCESNDQENFEGTVNLKYNYILELMSMDLQKKLNPNVKQMYKSLKRNPYSICMYAKVIEELKERNESLNLLQDLQEKELKCF
ncbi:unnamed protein product [Paramecium primaurelia]|uniref:Uncharacterized protein n=1 Tax=Paramecium primaurelia TaxID=5886 RepID=A0A8S1M2V5_PARPR|nr:unnamed protein product [Paramecium primaurelia]